MGQPHFRVGEKIFASQLRRGEGPPVDRLQARDETCARHRQGSSLSPAPYVGHKGWVSMDGRKVSDWDELRELILESYELIAPKKSSRSSPEAPRSSRRQSDRGGEGGKERMKATS